MKNIIYIPKKLAALLLSLLVITTIIFVNSLAYMGPSVALAQAATDSVVVTLNVTAGIAIDSPADVAMSRALSMTNMTAIGTSTWTVTTNNITGYSLTIKATSSPAMQQNSTTTIADYQTAAPNTWAVTSGNAKFGFSAYGTDVTTVPTNPWGSGSSCAPVSAHVPSTTLKYLGFTTSTSSPEIARRSATTTFAGSATTVCFAVEQNGFYIPSGAYSATITATAVTI